MQHPNAGHHDGTCAVAKKLLVFWFYQDMFFFFRGNLYLLGLKPDLFFEIYNKSIHRFTQEDVRGLNLELNAVVISSDSADVTVTLR